MSGWRCTSMRGRGAGRCRNTPTSLFGSPIKGLWRCARIARFGVTEFQENRTEGASLYFLDPDGHKLEVHVGDLESRLRAARTKPGEGLELLESG